MSKNKIPSGHPPNPKQNDKAEKAFAQQQFNKPGGQSSSPKK